jgi:hypothetical protein
MSPGEWIAIGSVLVTAGGALAKLGSLDARMGKLEATFDRSREDQGRRLGELETKAAVQRAMTDAAGVPVTTRRRGDEG